MAEQAVMALKRRKYPKPRPEDEYKPMDLNYKDKFENILYWGQNSGQKKEFYEELAKKMITWAKKKDSEEDSQIIFHDFLDENDLSAETLGEWIKKSPVLAKAYKHTLRLIGANRERGALRRRLDSSVVIKSMPIYSDEWKKLLEWQSKLNDDSSKQGTTIKVVMPEIPKIDEKKK